MRNIIIKLGLYSAINAIENTEQVYYRHGVWNKYDLAPTAEVINDIIRSGYGADVLYDGDEEMYYVSIPNDSDMW